MEDNKEINEYEAVIILKPNMKEAKLNYIDNIIKNKINSIAMLIKEDNLGTKKLAYEIKKYKEGYYKIYLFKTKENDDNNINKLQVFFRNNEDILKFIIVKRG